MVRKILSALRCKHSCRMMRLPRVSNNLLSVLNSSRTLTMKLVKYDSSDEAEIWARSCRSCLTTYIISTLAQAVNGSTHIL